MKKVLVTGAGGFIGSHLTEELIKKGYDVKAFVRYNSSGSWGHLEASEYKKDIEIYQGDIRDFDSVYRATQGVDAVLHLAALIGIPYSYDSPKAYIDTNVNGTYNILESARMHKTDKVVLTSTSEIYGTAQYVPIDEKHPVNPQSPYAATKAGADHLGLSYEKSFGLPVSILRPFNTYGPRQSARAIIPTIMTQLIAGQKQIKLGNLTPTRDLNYVKDTAHAFIAMMEAEHAIGKVLNAGSDFEISIGDLVNKIIGISGKNAEIVVDESRLRPQNSEVERLWANAEQLKSLTGWKPNYTLDEGLKETFDWLVKNMDKYRPGEYMK